MTDDTFIRIIASSIPVLLLGAVSIIIFYANAIERRLGRIEDKLDMVDRRVSRIEGNLNMD